VRVGLVVPGFSAAPDDWCIPALRHLARRLAVTDHLRVIALRYPYRADRYTLESFEVVSLGGGLRRRAATLGLWRTAFELLVREHHRQPFDVLHAFWATESGCLAALAGRRLRVPVLVSLAGGELVRLDDIGYGDQRLAWERLKIATALRLATGVSAGSQQLAQRAQRRSRRRVRRLPLGVDTRLFHPVGPAPRAGQLVHVGALVPVKDQALLLRAFALLRQHRPEARLDLVGAGPLRRTLEVLAGELGVEGSVRFVGQVEHGHLAACYAAAAACVVTSRHEAQCMAALEAAACGRPSVGTPVGVLPELAPTAATLAPGREPRALAAALAAALEDAAASGAAAQARVEHGWSLDGCTAAFRAAYAELID